MDILILLLLIVLLVIFINTNNSQTALINKLQRKLDNLLNQTNLLKEELQNLSSRPPQPGTEPLKDSTPKEEPGKVWQPPRPVAQEPPPAEPFTPKIRKELKEVPAPAYQPMHKVRESWMQKWLLNNPDLEKFIGENLVNKIGIAVLVLGIAFFVKYAIDKNWINQLGRVSIGLVCGALLVALAHRLRLTYRSFSSVLAGGGIAVFYFTIAFAFHEYLLISQAAAFIIMIVITAFAILLSLLYDRIELAVIALVGGFITPFLVSTGQGNYIVLFTYLIILNCGLLALAFFKRWSLINILALFFTEFIFGGWLTKTLLEQNSKVSYPLALFFATVLYLLFLGINTIYQVKYKKAFRAFEYSLLLLLNGSFFAAGMLLLQRVNHGEFQGLFTLGIGCINLVLAWYFFRQQQAQKPLLYLLIGLTLSFLSLAIPVQLHGHAITLFWSVEFVLLLWLYQQWGIRLFYYSSLLVICLAGISLLMDWSKTASADSELIVLIYSGMRGLVTNIVAACSFGAYAILLRKQDDKLTTIIPKKTLVQTVSLIAVVITYLTAFYGVNLLFRHFTNYEVPNVYHRLITEIAVAIILFVFSREATKSQSWPIAASVSVYLIYHLFSVPLIAGLRNGVLNGSYQGVHLASHWLSVTVALYLVYQSIQVIRKTPVHNISSSRLSWVISVLLLIFFSHEARHLFVVLGFNGNNLDYLEEQYARAVLTIVWALSSFGLMWLGMHYKSKTLRIISLCIFSLALLKLFFFDIADVSEAGKIVAFILLGVLLLTISFMYQKLKKIIIDNEKH
jgi:uncharacterized membrane protein